MVSVTGILHAAGATPLLQIAAIILGTFILEDAATVLSAMQVEAGHLGWKVALGALYIGVILGDLGLYGVGRLGARWPWLLRVVRADRRNRGREWLQDRVFRVVFISRFIPGARLPTYTACGFLNASFPRFALAAIVATSIWTTLLFLVSLRVGEWLMSHLGAWRWAGAIGFAAMVILAGRVAAKMQKDPA